MKRIDFLGNANSYPLTIAVGMRSLGYDVHMHLIDDYYLNDPKNLYSEFSNGYPDWIHDWRPFNIPFSLDEEKLDALERCLQSADALVLNLGAVCLGYGQKRPYFCLLTGTDLLTYCDDSFLLHDNVLAGQDKPLSVSSYLEFLCKSMLVDFQRESIREANGYSFFPRALQPSAAGILERIGADEERQCSLLVADTDRLTFTKSNLQPHGKTLRVLVAARCTWRKDVAPFLTALDYKGTDVFLRGAALAVQNGLDFEISLFRKGMHVQQTMDLIDELGLQSICCWHEECPQYVFHQHIREHDIIVDSLDLSHIGMASADAFALGRPVIAGYTSSQDWGIADAFPVCAVSDSEQVAMWLKTLSSKNDYDKIALEGREFAEKYLTPAGAAQKIIDSLQRPSPARMSKPGASVRRNLFRNYVEMKRISKQHEFLASQIHSTKFAVNLAMRNIVKKVFSWIS